MSRYLLGLGALIACWALLLTPVGAQTNILRGIRALDTNFNERLEPYEITNRARPQLKRIAPYDRIDILKPNSLSRWEEAVYRYYERRRSGERRVRPDPPSAISDFEPDDDDVLIPGFGLGRVKYPYTREDLEEADDTLDRADRNRDGHIDRSEARRARWTRTNPFSSDYNKDNRLSRIELAQRYAARRELEDGRERRYTTMRRVRDGLDRYADPDRHASRNSIDRRVRILSDSLLRRFDSDRNRRLDPTELKDIGLELISIDLDRNDEVTRDELDEWVRREVDARGDGLTEALPEWFFERDFNRDGQIQMSEYDDDWPEEKLREFEHLDANNDGIITRNELLRATDEGGTFRSEKAEVMPPHSTIVSEIEVTEDVIISDLNVQLSITHTFVAHLDGYLIGPDGHRIELFTGVGRDGDHFEETVFDDDSKTNINKARSPFRGSFQPESIAKKESGLDRYKEKSLKGVWQLMIRASRSERPGLLHSWSLIVEPAGKEADAPE